MKIFHAITSLDKGGAENHLATLTTEQIKNNNKVFIFISKNSIYWVNYLKKKNIKIFKSNYFNERSFLYKFVKLVIDIIYLIKLINKHRPDILHAHLPYMEIVTFVSLFFLKYKPKFIVTKHVDSDFFRGSRDQNKTFFGSLLAKIISLKTEKVIAISHSVKKFFVYNFFSINKKKIKVIYYGLDNLNVFSRNKKKFTFKVKKSKNILIIGCIARLVPQKSIHNLINYLSIFRELNLKLIIVGKGPLKNTLLHQAKNLKVNSKIIWFDFIDDIKNFYKKIDIFVLTSRFEGLGLVFLEAMLSKKPVICTNTSAMREIVKNNYNGFRVKAEDPNELHKAIIKLKKKNIRNKFGLRGYKFVKSNFSIMKMYKETQKIYLQK